MTTPTPRDGVPWPLVGCLAGLSLLHPVAHLSGLADGLGRTTTSVVLAVAIGIIWVLVIGTGAVRRPVRTSLLTGLTASVLLGLLGLLLSPVLDDELSDRAFVLVALVPVTLFHLLYGLVVGVIALALQRTRGVSPHGAVGGRA